MSVRGSWIFTLALLLVPVAGHAQEIEDDMLAPLTPGPSLKSKSKAKPKKRRVKVPPRRQSPRREEEAVLAPLAPKRTELWVKVTGAGDAELSVDERWLGPVPPAGIPVEPGPHSVTVRRPGFREVSRQVVVKEGQVLDLPVALEAVAGVVSVEVSADGASVGGASVTIDGAPVGMAPVRGLLLSPGSHELRVRREGYRDEVSRIGVRAGKDYQFKIQLQRGAPAVASREASGAAAALPADAVAEVEESAFEPRDTPWFKRWYVWAGVGMAAAAAVGTTVMLTREAGPGGFSPAQTCAPDACDGVLGSPPGMMRF